MRHNAYALIILALVSLAISGCLAHQRYRQLPDTESASWTTGQKMRYLLDQQKAQKPYGKYYTASSYCYDGRNMGSWVQDGFTVCGHDIGTEIYVKGGMVQHVLFIIDNVILLNIYAGEFAMKDVLCATGNPIHRIRKEVTRADIISMRGNGVAGYEEFQDSVLDLLAQKMQCGFITTDRIERMRKAKAAMPDFQSRLLIIASYRRQSSLKL